MERLTETVERFEEDMTDKARTHGRWCVIVQIDEAIEIGPNKNGAGERLTEQLQTRIQAMIHQMNRSGSMGIESGLPVGASM